MYINLKSVIHICLNYAFKLASILKFVLYNLFINMAIFVINFCIVIEKLLIFNLLF